MIASMQQHISMYLYLFARGALRSVYKSIPCLIRTSKYPVQTPNSQTNKPGSKSCSAN
jgi:hypothetical protein